MTDEQKLKAMWKILDEVKKLSDDPAEQALICTNVASFINNDLSTQAIRQTIYNYLNPK